MNAYFALMNSKRCSSSSSSSSDSGSGSGSGSSSSSSSSSSGSGSASTTIVLIIIIFVVVVVVIITKSQNTSNYQACTASGHVPFSLLFVQYRFSPAPSLSSELACCSCPTLFSKWSAHSCAPSARVSSHSIGGVSWCRARLALWAARHGSSGNWIK